MDGKSSIIGRCRSAAAIGIVLWLQRTGHAKLLSAWDVLVWLAATLLIGLIVLAIMMSMTALVDLVKQLSK